MRQMKLLWSNVNPKMAEYMNGAVELESCECACEVGTVCVKIRVEVSMFGLL